MKIGDSQKASSWCQGDGYIGVRELALSITAPGSVLGTACGSQSIAKCQP